MELLYCCNLVGLQLVLSLYIYRYSLYKTFQNFPVRQHRQFYFLFDVSEKLLVKCFKRTGRNLYCINGLDQRVGKRSFIWEHFFCSTPTYSRVPIRRGVWNKRSGTQDEKCIGRNISHMCLGLFSRCRFILTNLYLKVLHFDILIQLKDTAHFLENVLGLVKEVCRINVPCLLIGKRE